MQSIVKWMGNSQRDTSNWNIVKVEFMTKRQEEKKKQALKKMIQDQDNNDDFEIFYNQEDFYNVDFRQEIYVPKSVKVIDVAYVMKYVNYANHQNNQTTDQLGNNDENDDDSYPDLTEFVATKVKRKQLYINNQFIDNENYKISMSQCVNSTPVFEFIYERNSFFEALKQTALYTFRSFRRNILSTIARFLGLAPLLNAIKSLTQGSKIGVVSALCSKRIFSLLGTMALGPNMYVGGLSLILRMFFPFAAPILFLLRMGTG